MLDLIDFMLPVRLCNFLGLSPPWAPIPKVDQPVRVGLIGASKVATYGVIWPARRMPEVDVVAVAARDGRRAKEYAQQNKIPKAYGSYAALLADPDIDAVYIGLPAGLHGEWARQALAAGKHVLCEKPFTANAEEAREVQQVARRRGLVCREAFHWREHPIVAAAVRLLRGGAIGELRGIQAVLEIPDWTITKDDICWVPKLAGGAMMEGGCYCINAMRLFAGPAAGDAVVKAASAVPSTTCPGFIDQAMRGEVFWTGGGRLGRWLQGSFQATLQKRHRLLPTTDVTVVGSKGSMQLSGFVMPFISHTLTTRITLPDHSTEVRRYRDYGTNESQYYYQLERFAHHVLALKGRPSPCTVEEARAAMDEDERDAVANMQLLTDVYRAAGLPQRVPTSQFLDSMVQPLQLEQQAPAAEMRTHAMPLAEAMVAPVAALSLPGAKKKQK